MHATVATISWANRTARHKLLRYIAPLTFLSCLPMQLALKYIIHRMRLSYAFMHTIRIECVKLISNFLLKRYSKSSNAKSWFDTCFCLRPRALKSSSHQTRSCSRQKSTNVMYQRLLHTQNIVLKWYCKIFPLLSTTFQIVRRVVVNAQTPRLPRPKMNWF